MTVKEIRGLARSLGVKNYHQLRKSDLIRSIQVKEGNSPRGPIKITSVGADPGTYTNFAFK